MSERALAFSNEPLKHRHLVIFEAAALTSGFATYVIRSLLSEGRLRYETVEKTRDGLVSKLIEREGPTAHALLHRASRRKDEDGRIIAEIIDCAVVRDLIADPIAEGADATIKPEICEVVNAVAGLIADSKSEVRQSESHRIAEAQ